jgi:hypothetical protein
VGVGDKTSLVGGGHGVRLGGRQIPLPAREVQLGVVQDPTRYKGEVCPTDIQER